MISNTVARYAIREGMGLIIMAVALFWPAGTLGWWQAWACLGVVALWSIGIAVAILRTNPELLAERLGPRQGTRGWDMAILSVMGAAQLARYVLAGFDHRLGWSSGIAAPAQITALAVGALGYALFVWAVACNAFFSQIVRIQSERGQRVVTGGPYQAVRHPAYAGAIVFELAVPLLLGSWLAGIPSLIGALLLILRTALEDRVLKDELPGYADYTREVRYRLLPGVW